MSLHQTDLRSLFARHEVRVPAKLCPTLPSEIFARPHRLESPSGMGSRGMNTTVHSLSVGASSAQRQNRDKSKSKSKTRRRSKKDTPLSPGTVVGKYRIEELLGRGAFAHVYRATHLLLQTPVAIKLLHRSLVDSNPKLVDLLCEESRYTARLDHRNVVRIYDVTRDGHATYIILEWVAGPTLGQAIKKAGRLSPTMVVQVGLDVASGLDAALRCELIHRDIKPANILLTPNGEAKIIDLGLARRSRVESIDPKTTTLALDAVVGTPTYMAPEQAASARNVDFRADIYSLGATLYHATVGEPPAPYRDTKDVARLLTGEPHPRASERCSDVPRDLDDLLAWMLEIDPNDRPSSYIELREALQGIDIAQRLNATN